MTIGELLRLGRSTYALEPLESQLLLAQVLDMPRAKLLAYTEQEVSAQDEENFRRLAAQRQGGMPLQYLLGTANFMGLDFKVAPGVLIPRFDTEVLAERALELIGDKKCRIADICTGSGAIAVSLSVLEPQSEVWAVDLSQTALKVAEENNKRLGAKVHFLQGDLLEPLAAAQTERSFDLLVSNPPYITTAEMAELPTDVQKEPVMALWGGSDGLFFYRKLADGARKVLKPGGYLLLEVGYQQAAAVKELLNAAGWREICAHRDFQGYERVVEAKF